jgi:hypothetical protein
MSIDALRSCCLNQSHARIAHLCRSKGVAERRDRRVVIVLPMPVRMTDDGGVAL